MGPWASSPGRASGAARGACRGRTWSGPPRWTPPCRVCERGLRLPNETTQSWGRPISVLQGSFTLVQDLAASALQPSMGQLCQRRLWLTSLRLGRRRAALARRHRRRGLVRLPRGPVEGHNPVVGVLLVLGGKQHAVTLANSVEKVLSAFKVCNKSSS